MSHLLAAGYRTEYSQKYGREYDSAEFAAPLAIFDAEQRRLLAKLKIADAHVRQMDIDHEIQEYRKGDVAILPYDKKHLMDECEDAKKVMEKWEPFRS